MEKFIIEGEMLLTKYEWLICSPPKEKVLQTRKKLVADGQAKALEVSAFFEQKAKKKNIKRKT